MVGRLRTHMGAVGATLLLALSGTLPARADVEQAKSAEAFVESIGVNAHWNYPDTPYGAQYEKVKQLLVDAGIRHVRGDFSRARDLAKSGVTTMVSLTPPHGVDANEATLAKMKEQVKAANSGGLNAIDWVEGPNEPDLFWVKTANGDKYNFGSVTYKGQGYAGGQAGIIAGVTAFQKDLYTAFKTDPATAHLKIVGPSLGITYGYDRGSPFPKGSLTDAVDYGNFHPYPGGNPFSDRAGYDTLDWYIGHGTQPSANLDEFKYAFDIYAPPFAPKPMACTETGYSTMVGGQTEDVQAKYIPRLFCEYFLHGIVRTYLYEFVDAFDNKTDRDSNFGLVRHDLTPKPSYPAVKNLIGLLSDRGGAGFQPGSLDFSLAVSPVRGYVEPGSGKTVDYDRTKYVHHLLLQKRSGVFCLLLWHEISDEDGGVTPHRIVTPPAMPVTISLPPSIRTATAYYPNDRVTGAPVPIVSGVISIAVPDRVLLLRLSSR
jgi:hypothetical protein